MTDIIAWRLRKAAAGCDKAGWHDADAMAIGNLWRKACQSLLDSTRYYIECGHLLIAKKESVGHGNWLAWLKANAEVLGFENITVVPQRLMKAAREYSTSTLNLDDPATALAINRQLWGNANVRGTQGTGENEWYTPGEYLAMAREVLGEIDLDPASSDEAQGIIEAAHYFTKADDGLAQEWHGRVWLNPPYAQPLIADFVAKLVAERLAGLVTAAIMLTHNYTDTAWFHEAAGCADAICFTRGRVKFYEPDGEIAAPTQGQAFFYFGRRIGAFVERFRSIGFVVRPCG
jgi:phage N-6-adenine-methyltransferase